MNTSSYHRCEAQRAAGAVLSCVGHPLYLVQVLSALCSAIGLGELIVKVMGSANGQRAFFASYWNVLDAGIVIVSAVSSTTLWWGLSVGIHPTAAIGIGGMSGGAGVDAAALHSRNMLHESRTSVMEVLKLGRALRVMRLITLEKRFRR